MEGEVNIVESLLRWDEAKFLLNLQKILKTWKIFVLWTREWTQMI